MWNFQLPWFKNLSERDLENDLIEFEQLHPKRQLKKEEEEKVSVSCRQHLWKKCECVCVCVCERVKEKEMDLRICKLQSTVTFFFFFFDNYLQWHCWLWNRILKQMSHQGSRPLNYNLGDTYTCFYFIQLF